MTENYVASAFAANEIPLYYWQSDGEAVVGSLIQSGSIVPVEVKASSHVRSRSLSVYRERFKPQLSIRLSTRNFGYEEGLFSVPLYAAWLINWLSLLEK